MHPLLLVGALALLAGCAAPPDAAADPVAPAAAPERDPAPEPGAAPAPEAAAEGDEPAEAAAAGVRIEGTSSVNVLVACVPDVEGGVCVLTAREWGTFELADEAEGGRLTLEWEAQPNLQGVRAYLMLGEEALAEASGEAPLAMAAPPLAAGTYEVRVFPDTSVGPVDVAVAWTYESA